MNGILRSWGVKLVMMLEGGDCLGDFGFGGRRLFGGGKSLKVRRIAK